MSDAHPTDHSVSDAGMIKTPGQLILTMLLGFMVPMAVIVMITKFVTLAPHTDPGAMDPEALARRIAPVGEAKIKIAAAAGSYKTGEEIYTAVCSACHAAGVLGAPKFGDEAAWAPRIKTGYDSLLHSALNGKNSMPAKGGSDYSDYEIARAVVYMADKGGAKFDEPKPPADAASAAPAAAAAASAASAP